MNREKDREKKMVKKKRKNEDKKNDFEATLKLAVSIISQLVLYCHVMCSCPVTVCVFFVLDCHK